MKHKAFLLIMSHSLRAGPGQGVSEVQSVTHKVAGGFGLLIKGDLICSGYCRGKKKNVTTTTQAESELEMGGALPYTEDGSPLSCIPMSFRNCSTVEMHPLIPRVAIMQMKSQEIFWGKKIPCLSLNTACCLPVD